MKKKIILFISLFLISINSIYAKETVALSNCVDGDTIKIMLAQKQYTVRMLAIDTPESVHPTKGIEYYGKEASEYTCNLVTNANKIEIEYDNNSDKSDKYDRLIAWVFIDGELLQKKLIENGYAKVAYLYGDYKYTNDLKKIQELTAAKNIGIWDENAKNKYNNEHDISNDIEDEEIEDKNQTTKEDLTYEAILFVEKLKKLKITDYIIIGSLLLVFLLCSNKKIKNKAKKKLKKYLKKHL